MATTLNKILPDLSKLELLEESNYKCWSHKFLIFFELLEVDYALFNEPPADVVADSSNAAATIVVDDATKKKFEKDNKTVRGHLLNHMTNPLFDLFINYKSAKVIWDCLEKKYGADDAGKRSMWLESGSSFRWLMISQSWSRRFKQLCINKELFHDYEESANALNNVLYVPSLHRNLVSGALRNKTGLKLVFESDKVVISRRGDFVGKGYHSGTLFVLNIAQEITNNVSTFNSAYIAESIDLWHEAKHTKKPFKNVTSRKTELLKLGHSDLVDFKNIISKGGEKSYITFVDDSSRYIKVPFKKLDKTPYELWKGFAHNLKILKVWGCLANVGLPDFKYVTIGPKIFDAIFIGYAQNSVAYRFMSLNDSSIYESRDVEFFEHDFPLKNNLPSDVHNNSSTSMSINSHIVPSSNVTANEHENELRRSKRRRIEASFGPDFITTFLTKNIDLDILNSELVSIYLIEEDPMTYNEAMRLIDASFWKETIKSELDSIVSNHTWDLSNLPKGCKPISRK
ncbi:uncharacterized protein [Nicotiana tomentosiformis]|uniref:uncharacterized protein n=1 Tax=Nicotiana tomentosiformis TaxID=4098 RepID=UPI00388CA3EB